MTMAFTGWLEKYTPTERRKLIAKRDKYRNSHCIGCRYNYYNFSKGASSNGDVAVGEDYFCWSLPNAKPLGKQGLICNTGKRR